MSTQPPSIEPKSIFSSVAKMLATARAGNVAPEDYKGWLCTMLPEHFRGVDQFAPHHEQYWEHVWNLPKDAAPLACLAVWNRGGMKSTSAEATGPVLAARKLRSFGLYVSGTQDKADGHLATVKEMLINSNLRDYEPSLGRPEVKMIDDRRVPGAWNHAELTTDGGLYMIAVGLDKSVRGLKRGSQRPDFIIFDDIEDEDDTPYAVLKKISRIKSGILPAGSENCAVFFPQNLIHRDSVISQVVDGRADMLHEHFLAGGIPVPALFDIKDSDYEDRGLGAQPRYLIKGEPRPSWPQGFPVEVCQTWLNKVGLRTWQLEYQHKVNTPYEDAIFPGFSEVHHVITWSEFARVYAKFGAIDQNGKPRIPARGNCGFTFDQGTTIGHPTVGIWDWQPSEEMPYNKCLFFYRELCRPRFPHTGGAEVIVPEEVGMEIQDLERVWHDNVKFRQGSHEAKAVRNSWGYYLGTVPGYTNMVFSPIKTTQKTRGIVSIQDMLGINLNLPHAFRIDPRTLTGRPEWCSACSLIHDGRHLTGMPGMFLIVDDRQGQLYTAPDGALLVAPALDEAGFSRTRWEFPKYRHRRTVQGMETKELPKIDDDAMDVLIAATVQRLRIPDEKTEQIVEEERMPAKLRADVAPEVKAQNPYYEMQRATALAAVRDQRKQEIPKPWRADVRAKLRARPR